jgi:hypothetical protein
MHTKCAGKLDAWRAVAVLMLAVALLAAAIAVPPAGAQPGEECFFVLSPPRLTTVNNASVITATMHPVHCDGRAGPTRSTVCIDTADAPAACATAYAWNSAQVFVGPSESASYTAHGEGCFNDIFGGAMCTPASVNVGIRSSAH